jgi:hypothetical protein
MFIWTYFYHNGRYYHLPKYSHFLLSDSVYSVASSWFIHTGYGDYIVCGNVRRTSTYYEAKSGKTFLHHTRPRKHKDENSMLEVYCRGRSSRRPVDLHHFRPTDVLFTTISFKWLHLNFSFPICVSTRFISFLTLSASLWHGTPSGCGRQRVGTMAGHCEQRNKLLLSIKCGEFLDWMRDC